MLHLEVRAILSPRPLQLTSMSANKLASDERNTAGHNQSMFLGQKGSVDWALNEGLQHSRYRTDFGQRPSR